jgi:lipoate-protein ligase A
MTETNVWRLIRSGPLSGAMNMALDDVLLQEVAAGRSLPVLRLYRWCPATLTLGYAQTIDSGIDLAACRAAGVAVVRRPTGGRAVLHDREVTYAVIAPAAPPFGRSVGESYQVIAEVLRATLERCGLPVRLVPGRPRHAPGRAVCFTAPAQHELLIAGRKVAGCAQKRQGGAFLQHGSIPLELDVERLHRLMPAADARPAGERFAGVGWLQHFAERPLIVDEIEDALVAGFAAALQLRFIASEPSEAELALARELCAARYENPAWTLRGDGRGSTGRSADGD